MREVDEISPGELSSKTSLLTQLDETNLRDEPETNLRDEPEGMGVHVLGVCDACVRSSVMVLVRIRYPTGIYRSQFLGSH